MVFRPRVRARTSTAALLLLVLLGAPACSGYSTQRLTDFPRARTIAVMPFTNLGFRRDLALRLSEAVATEIRAQSNLGFGTVDNADLILTGRMDAREIPTVLDQDGEPIQKRLEGWVEVVITERATGRVLRRQRVATIAEWSQDIPGETLGGSATEEWTRRLAERVAQVLERPF